MLTKKLILNIISQDNIWIVDIETPKEEDVNLKLFGSQHKDSDTMESRKYLLLKIRSTNPQHFIFTMSYMLHYTNPW